MPNKNDQSRLPPPKTSNLTLREQERFRDPLENLRGPNGARDEFHLAAAPQNLRKLAKLMPNGPRFRPT